MKTLALVVAQAMCALGPALTAQIDPGPSSALARPPEGTITVLPGPQPGVLVNKTSGTSACWVVNVDGDSQGTGLTAITITDHVETLAYGSTYETGTKDDDVRDKLVAAIQNARSDIDVIKVGDTSIILDPKWTSSISAISVIEEDAHTRIEEWKTHQPDFAVIDIDPIGWPDIEIAGSEDWAAGDGTLTVTADNDTAAVTLWATDSDFDACVKIYNEMWWAAFNEGVGQTAIVNDFEPSFWTSLTASSTDSSMGLWAKLHDGSAN